MHICIRDRVNGQEKIEKSTGGEYWASMTALTAKKHIAFKILGIRTQPSICCSNFYNGNICIDAMTT